MAKVKEKRLRAACDVDRALLRALEVVEHKHDLAASEAKDPEVAAYCSGLGEAAEAIRAELLRARKERAKARRAAKKELAQMDFERRLEGARQL